MTTTRGRVRVEPGQKRVRVMLAGEWVVDTDRPVLVWERPYYPTYYVPADDVADSVLRDTGQTDHSPSRGTAHVYDVVVGERVAVSAARRYPDSPIEDLRGLVAFDWPAMDHWFEEDEEVFVHPRDPYTRVDILPSSRHVRVDVGGETVAESSHPTLLFETGLPVRYYLPKTDVRLDRLSPTDTVTRCPYKGAAHYWSVTAGGETHVDLAWGYDAPVRESAPIAGLVCFYNEKVDLFVDGEPVERPRTHFA